jgi:hypothetical protein
MFNFWNLNFLYDFGYMARAKRNFHQRIEQSMCVKAHDVKEL